MNIIIIPSEQEIDLNLLELDGQYISIIDRNNHNHSYNYSLPNNSKTIKTNFEIDGPACSAALTEFVCNRNEPLLIINPRKKINLNISHFLQFIGWNHVRGMIGCLITHTSDKPNDAYIKLDYHKQYVTEVKERELISDYAASGIYYFRTSQIFFDAVKRMINNFDMVYGGYHIPHVYNYISEKYGCIKTKIYMEEEYACTPMVAHAE